MGAITKNVSLVRILKLWFCNLLHTDGEIRNLLRIDEICFDVLFHFSVWIFKKKKSICSLFFFSKEKSLQFVFLSEIERFNVCMDGGIIESINERKRLNLCYKNLHSVNHLWCAWNLTEKKRARTHIGKNYVDLCATLMHSGALK